MGKLLRLIPAVLLFAAVLPAHATPFFARNYGLSCQTCHSGFPRLNEFGLYFKANNFRIPGLEKNPPLAWHNSPPFTAQVQPVYQRFSPKPNVSQYTDTQLLVGGLLTRGTAFYLHHSYFIDTTPTEFPSYEFWVQQVVSEREKLFLKVGQFELPFGYSPVINRTTPSIPLVFGTGLQGNDVRLGSAMNGVMVSMGRPGGLQAQLAYGEPASLASGNLNSEHFFFGRFRDTFFRVSYGKPSQQIAFFVYATDPPRDPDNPQTENRGQRYGLEGTFLLRNNVQLQTMLVYGENADPTGNGSRGFFRGGFLEADWMALPWLGVTGRYDAQTTFVGGAKTYSEAYTAAIRFYPVRTVKLSAEYQQYDHNRSSTTLMAAITF